MEMAKKKPRGHNIGGSYKQKRRKEKKGEKQSKNTQNNFIMNRILDSKLFFHFMPKVSMSVNCF